MEEESEESISESPYPPAYWEEKMTRNLAVLEHLKCNPEMKRALIDNPDLAQELMKHPHIAKEIAKDPKLAKLVIAKPALIVDLALVHRDLKNPSHNVHRNSDKSHKKQQSYPVLMQESMNNRLLTNTCLSEHANQPEQIKPLDIIESQISQVSRATRPNVQAPVGEPDSLKYLVDASRLFMSHHVEVADGVSTCCDVKREYFDVLNVYGRLMYRVYEERPSQNYCGIFRPFEMVVKEPDGTASIIMIKRYDLCRTMRKIGVFCPPGTYVGSVEENWGVCSPKIVLRNREGDAMIEIRVLRRPFISRFVYHPNFEFELRTIGAHNSIGKIAAEWLDLPPGAFPNEKIYGINFPRELSCHVKLIVMTAWFLIYNLYFHGKLNQLVRHDLGDSDRALLAYAEGEGKNKSQSYDPSSDSD